MRTVLVALVTSAALFPAFRAEARGPGAEPGMPSLAYEEAAYVMDSGMATNPLDVEAVVWSTDVVVPDAGWLRLFFEKIELAGDPTAGTGAYLLITSLIDGGTQRLDGVAAAQWRGSTAYFNGEAVAVQLVAPPRSGPSRVALASVQAGRPPLLSRSICGAEDDRVLSSDARLARLLPNGCSAWLINDVNHQFLTAGHCAPLEGDVCQFNVPLSTQAGTLVNPPPEDQYYVEHTSVQATYVEAGHDACYFGVYPNPNTGLTPFQRQGAAFVLAGAAPAASGGAVRVTGYGTVMPPVPLSWYQVQQSASGLYLGLSGSVLSYEVDTTGGNSGAPVLQETTGLAIGIHTHAGCTSSPGSANRGTAIQSEELQGYLRGPMGICASGVGAVTGPLYVATDLNNNFGTADIETGGFAKVSLAPAPIQGLAYDRNDDLFYAVDTGRRLYTVEPESGVFSDVGLVTGLPPGLIINGLGYDPDARVLYGIAQGNGQLFRIDVRGAATPVGPAAGDSIGGIDFDAAAGILYGLSDMPSGTLLVRISTTTGERTVVGALRSGVVNCDGLAWNDADGQLYAINTATADLLRINPGTGAATIVGPTGGMFAGTADGTTVGAYGMAVRQGFGSVCPADLNHDGMADFADYLEFLNLYDARDPRVDFTADGLVDFSDYLAFLNFYEAGC